MDFQYVPTQISLADSIENDSEYVVYEIATCHINYTMHGDAITTAIHVDKEKYTYIHNIMSSDEWTENGPWGSESMSTHRLLSLRELLNFIEVINTECRFSHWVREALEDLIDHNRELSIISLKEQCAFSSDIYPELSEFFDIVADDIITYWKDHQCLPNDIELQNIIIEKLE